MHAVKLSQIVIIIMKTFLRIAACEVLVVEASLEVLQCHEKLFCYPYNVKLLKLVLKNCALEAALASDQRFYYAVSLVDHHRVCLCCSFVWAPNSR
jgi:hypothetical protein